MVGGFKKRGLNEKNVTGKIGDPLYTTFQKIFTIIRIFLKSEAPKAPGLFTFVHRGGLDKNTAPRGLHGGLWASEQFTWLLFFHMSLSFLPSSFFLGALLSMAASDFLFSIFLFLQLQLFIISST